MRHVPLPLGIFDKFLHYIQSGAPQIAKFVLIFVYFCYNLGFLLDITVPYSELYFFLQFIPGVVHFVHQICFFNKCQGISCFVVEGGDS